MENDKIRSSGTNTLVDIWVDGRMREIVITFEALAAAAGAERAAAMTEDERCEFIRSRLAAVQRAARTTVAEGSTEQGRITLKAARLVDPALGSGGERRRADRRSSDRRATEGLGNALPAGERRRRDRRRGDRRGTLSADTPA